MINRRTLIASGIGALAASAGIAAYLSSGSSTSAAEVEVFKSPSCGCCGAWANHLSANGFSVSVTRIDDLDPIKKRLGVPYELESCHTATIGGYVIEGHVPAQDIQRLLREKPDAVGLAVPGMPSGSPGMDAGGAADRYSVILFRQDGSQTVFSRY